MEEAVSGLETAEGDPRLFCPRAEETGSVVFRPDEGPKAQTDKSQLFPFIHMCILDLNVCRLQIGC